jgi:hypothetical protein
VLFDGFLARGGQLLELIHDEGGGDACKQTSGDAAENGWFGSFHVHLSPLDADSKSLAGYSLA